MKNNPLEIAKLCNMEATVINNAYDNGRDNLARLLIRIAIDSYRKFLVKQQGEFVNGFNLDFRIFIVGLLEEIKEEYFEKSFGEILGYTNISKEYILEGKDVK